MGVGFTFAHSSQPVPSARDLPVSFSITASAATDVWEKPPATSSFNAPILYRAMPLRSFKRARVSITAAWTQLYDQGGLILVINPPGTSINTHTHATNITNGINGIANGVSSIAINGNSSTAASKPQTPPKWIKTGIEVTAGKPHLSVVAKDRWADWSLAPVPSGGNAATIEMAREHDGSLWVYLVEGCQRVPLREVTWAFENEDDTAQCWIGAFAAKPSIEGEDLTVDFRHLIVVEDS